MRSINRRLGSCSLLLCLCLIVVTLHSSVTTVTVEAAAWHSSATTTGRVMPSSRSYPFWIQKGQCPLSMMSSLQASQKRSSSSFMTRRHGSDREDDLRDASAAATSLTRKKKQQQHNSLFPKLGSTVKSLLLALTLFWTPLLSNAHAELGSDPPPAPPATTSSSAPVPDRRYWTLLSTGEPQERALVNQKLLDFAVLAINTEYYDYSGGASFSPVDFYKQFRHWLRDANAQQVLTTREGAVQGLQWLVSQLPDPFSRYLTREELRAELGQSSHGFLGLGAMVVSPDQTNPFFGSLTTPVLANLPPNLQLQLNSHNSNNHNKQSTTAAASQTSSSSATSGSHHFLLSAAQVSKLPVISAVTPDSPAERAGLVVGDRIVAVGTDSFLSSSHAVSDMPARVQKYSGAENYVGWSELTIAKPVYAATSSSATMNTLLSSPMMGQEEQVVEEDVRDVIVAYRPTRVRLPTVLTAEDEWSSYWSGSGSNKNMADNDDTTSSQQKRLVAGGDSVVHYELLQSRGTIFDQLASEDDLLGPRRPPEEDASASSSSSSSSSSQQVPARRERSVGYIRPTRFSRASTQGFVRAVNELEQAGATSFIIDLRNNYGGILQEAMLIASSLLRDPHAVLCYTMNTHGGTSLTGSGLIPSVVEEYVVDPRFPGYLLSSESRSVTLDQVKREHPELLLQADNKSGSGWVLPQGSIQSLHEQQQQGAKQWTASHHRASARLWTAAATSRDNHNEEVGEWDHHFLSLPHQEQAQQTLVRRQLLAQKKIVLLINEGTASAAEVLAAALHDNGRTVALVGTKTFGKGLIQRTFPMPDGGGLRLTVAEYLTPSLRHVTRVGGAGFDRATGEWVGGGINPDIRCESRQGIPRNVGADLCVGMALDVLE